MLPENAVPPDIIVRHRFLFIADAGKILYKPVLVLREKWSGKRDVRNRQLVPQPEALQKVAAESFNLAFYGAHQPDIDEVARHGSIEPEKYDSQILVGSWSG